MIALYILAGSFVAFVLVMVVVARLLVQKERKNLQASQQPRIIVVTGYRWRHRGNHP